MTTGRARRCGWLDIPLLQYTSMVNGYAAIALTKLDILDDVEELQIGVAYRKNGKVLEHFPSSEQVKLQLKNWNERSPQNNDHLL